METAVRHPSLKAGLISDRARWTDRILPLILFLCFVIATTLGIYALSFLRTMLVTERRSELAMNAATVADTLDRILFERFGDVRLFANDGALRKGSPAEKSARLLEYKQLYGYYTWPGVADKSGRLMASTDSLAAQDTQSLNPDSVELVRRMGTIRLEGAHPSPEPQGNMAVEFTAPVYGPEGDFQGVVATRVPLQNLRTVFEQEGRLRYGDIAYDWVLLDREGTILDEKNRPTAMIDGPVKVVLASLTQAADEQGRSGFVEERHHHRGTPVVTGYAWTRGHGIFSGFGWLVLFRLDHDQVYAPVDRLVWMVGSVGLLVILPLTGYGIWVSWKLGRERNELVKARQDLEESVAELARSNAELKQFAYVASHDL
ncbi:MAG: Phytochrome, two-component sensor histidine kinase [Nitrospira sp.]|nr:MAG: Phytochrome, two-component sensor histidine kinase [Nitrospira sp.]